VMKEYRVRVFQIAVLKRTDELKRGELAGK
jgi:hypothetical protein